MQLAIQLLSGLLIIFAVSALIASIYDLFKKEPKKELKTNSTIESN